MSTGSEILSNLVGGLFPGREDQRERMRREIAHAGIGKPTITDRVEPPVSAGPEAVRPAPPPR